MAIIPWLKGLEVTVKVDGETANEFDPPEPERAPEHIKFHKLDQHRENSDPFIVKYIEVKPGAPFAFHLSLLPEFEFHGAYEIGFLAEVDGQLVRGVSCVKSSPNMTIRRTSHLEKSGVREGSDMEGWVKRPFRFSTLNIVEDGVPATEVNKQILQAQNMGYLRAYCYRLGKRTPIPRDYVDSASATALKAASTMSEKALKGRSLDCKVSLGEALPAQALSRYNVTYEDSKRRPFAVFEFRYRSLEGLYREGIVSRPEDTADPPHGPEADATPIRDVDVFALPEAEAREMLQRLLESRRNEPHIKPENPTGGNNDNALGVNESSRTKSESSRGVKRERSGSMETEAAFLARYKGRKLRNGAIEIDLTDD